MNALPAPLTPADCDLRDFPFMPLDVVRLRDSDFAAITEAEGFRAGLLLWCASWHQVPAASLPDDDVVLARLAGFGRIVKAWQKLRADALHGWVRCSDGRLYHPVVAEKARDAWQSKLLQRWKTECARLKKECQRKQQAYQPPTFEAWLSQGQAEIVPRDKPDLSRGQSGTVPDVSPHDDSGQDAAVPDVSLGKPPPRDRDRENTTQEANASFVVDTRDAPDGEPVPEDIAPCRQTVAQARSLGLDMALERERFVAYYRANGLRLRNRAAWVAKLRLWVLNQHQFNADRDRVTQARVDAAQRATPPPDARSAAADTLGVGSQYLAAQTPEPPHALDP